MTKKELDIIKEITNKAINAGDFEIAFETLWQIGVDAFIIFIQRKTWLLDGNHKESATYFWKTFIINDLYFDPLMTSSLTEVLLRDYYSKITVFSKDLELKISEHYPEIFVQAIKTNQVFFNREDKPDRIVFLTEEVQLPKELQIHQKVWKVFYERELDHWKKIENALDEIVRLPLIDVLQTTIYWIEENYLSTDNRGIQQTIADTYSFFIEMYTKHAEVNVNTNSIDQDTFEKCFLEKVFKDKIESDHIVVECLMLINYRKHLLDTYFDPYCFDKNMSPSVIYHTLYLTTLPEAHYKWKIDHLRYHLLEQSYFRIGGAITDGLIEKGVEISCNQLLDIEDNRELAKKRQGLITVLANLGMEFYFDKKNDTRITVEKVITFLQTFAFDYLVRYERKLKDYRVDNESWQYAFKNYSSLEKEVAVMPFIYLSKEAYKSISREYAKDFNDADSDTILRLFQYSTTTKKFNRFRTDYNVYLQPFLELGGYLFSPIVFFTSYTGVYVYVDTLLKNNSKENDTIIEDILAKLLEYTKWNILQLDDKQVNDVDGDADLILYDDDNVVLMQLKRTNLRLNTKEAYYNIDVDVKGAKQLNDAEKYFSKPNPYFKIDNQKVHKWIVSTSLEDLQTNIDGCLKLNYFDFFLLYSEIFDSESKDFESLDDFINYFGRDSVFVNILGEYPQLANQRSIDEMSAYHVPFSSLDEKKANTYNDLYNKALDLNDVRKNYESIAVFQKCLALENEDVLVHSAIANVYADIRDYKNAFYHFRKALSLLPNDPFIMTNFIVVLLESGNFFTAIIIDYIFKKFHPLIVDTRQKEFY